jgi:hypothetical protein
MSSGVSLPSSVGTPRIFIPPMRSGAPCSSVLMCAVVAATTAPQRGSIDCSAVTLAPVPLNTGYTSSGPPSCSVSTSRSRAVYTSSP